MRCVCQISKNKYSKSLPWTWKFKFKAQDGDLKYLFVRFDKRIALSEKSHSYLRPIIKALLGAFHCRKTYCWSFNSPIILMCKSFGQRLIDNHLWRSKSRRQLLNIGCHKNSLQSWRIGPFLNTCSSLDLSLMNLWLWSCKLIRKDNG